LDYGFHGMRGSTTPNSHSSSCASSPTPASITPAIGLFSSLFSHETLMSEEPNYPLSLGQHEESIASESSPMPFTPPPLLQQVCTPESYWSYPENLGSVDDMWGTMQSFFGTTSTDLAHEFTSTSLPNSTANCLTATPAISFDNTETKEPSSLTCPVLECNYQSMELVMLWKHLTLDHVLGVHQSQDLETYLGKTVLENLISNSNGIYAES